MKYHVTTLALLGLAFCLLAGSLPNARTAEIQKPQNSQTELESAASTRVTWFVEYYFNLNDRNKKVKGPYRTAELANNACRELQRRGYIAEVYYERY